MVNNLAHGKRRLAAIVFSDVAGYTAMMQTDEVLALQRITHYRSAVEDLVPAYDGQLIQFYGDGSLLVFGSPNQAVRWAIAIQREMSTAPEVPLRIGIHQGDIIFSEGNIFGDSVNIAARVESMSVPGAVLLSEKVRKELQNHQDIHCLPLGSFTFKNVKESMQVFAVEEEGLIVPDREKISGKFESQNTQKSIAVLAFENRSSDPEQEYFSDGIAEEIMYGLSRLENLNVASRSSSFAYKNSPKPITAIGNELQVGSVLEGSIRKAGSRVRVNVQLIDANDGFQMWSGRFDKELEDIFAIQDEIASEVVRNLELSLFGKEKRRPVVYRRTENVKAFELFLKGRSYLDQRVNIDAALDCFQQAVRIDPQFADAFTSIAYAYFYKIVFANYPPREGWPKAEAAVRKTLSLDETISEAHNMLGLYAFYFNYDWDGARQEYEHSILLDPRLADTYRIKAYFHTMVSEPREAVDCAKEAMAIDPVSFNNQISLADIYIRVRNFDKAIEVLRKVSEKYPDNAVSREMLGSAYVMAGDHDSAREFFDGRKKMPEFITFYNTARYVWAKNNGNEKLLMDFIDHARALRKSKWISPTTLSELYFHAGDEEHAIEMIRKAIPERDSTLPTILTNPLWDEYARHPAVLSVLEEIGLAQINQRMLS